MRNGRGSIAARNGTATAAPAKPPSNSGASSRHRMKRYTVTRLMACEAILQSIINGMAAMGSNTCRSTAPAAAENAKPENPLTTPPRNTADASAAISADACIAAPAIFCRARTAADLLPAGYSRTERNAFVELDARFDLPFVAGLARLQHGEERSNQDFGGDVLSLAMRLDQRHEPEIGGRTGRGQRGDIAGRHGALRHQADTRRSAQPQCDNRQEACAASLGDAHTGPGRPAERRAPAAVRDVDLRQERPSPGGRDHRTFLAANADRNAKYATPGRTRRAATTASARQLRTWQAGWSQPGGCLAANEMKG